MKQTKYGYICREEAMIDGHLDRWLKQKQHNERRPKGRRFYVPQTRVWRKTDEVQKETSTNRFKSNSGTANEWK